MDRFSVIEAIKANLLLNSFVERETLTEYDDSFAVELTFKHSPGAGYFFALYIAEGKTSELHSQQLDFQILAKTTGKECRCIWYTPFEDFTSAEERMGRIIELLMDLLSSPSQVRLSNGLILFTWDLWLDKKTGRERYRGAMYTRFGFKELLNAPFEGLCFPAVLEIPKNIVS